IGLHALVALGLVMLTGVGGMTSFGQAAFVGLGAYATAWVCTSPWVAEAWAGLPPALLPWLHLDRIYLRGFRVTAVHVPRGPAWAKRSDHVPLIAEVQFA
ncbi:MAG: hypothetical protein N3D71_11710, partial [Burkholderiaceae bacterium]|nr:hypothetical protein [Burkholderiaceae bacterium]